VGSLAAHFAARAKRGEIGFSVKKERQASFRRLLPQAGYSAKWSLSPTGECIVHSALAIDHRLTVERARLAGFLSSNSNRVASIMKTQIAFCFLLFCAVFPSRLLAQATDCNDPYASAQANAMAQQQWENQSSPVYVDATNLARDLATRGIKVECIRRSIEEHLFEGQKGAAWFKTNQGVFEVWFLPDTKAATVAVAKVTGRPAAVSLPSGPNEFFIQHQNVVFHVSQGDRTLAASLHRAFEKP
jgi:hypothetical protein